MPKVYSVWKYVSAYAHCVNNLHMLGETLGICLHIVHIRMYVCMYVHIVPTTETLHNIMYKIVMELQLHTHSTGECKYVCALCYDFITT